MAEAPRNRSGWDGAEAGAAAAKETKTPLRRLARDEWRVLGAGKSLPSSLGPTLKPSEVAAGPSSGMDDQFLHLAIRKQVSYR